MKLRTDKIVIPKEEPFKNDLLERKQYADVLTQIVMNTTGGFTLSINADWGYGKTTFIKMWEASLQNEGYKTIYFNAWKSDFVEDPMIALIDGIINGIGKTLTKNKKNFISALSKSLIQLGKLVPGLNSYAEIADAIQNGTDKLSEEEACLKEYKGINSVVNDFRDQLTAYAKKVGKKKPLIIFVDELDRCRPDYAVQMLERIKHFFEIENINFVISIDKEVIRESIKTVYGDIDVAGYLRRFVDLEFNLPKPKIDAFIETLYSQRLLEYILHNKSYLEAWSHKKSEIEIPFFLTKFLNATTYRSLRDIEKYFNLLEIVLRSSTPNADTFIYIMYFTYMYIFDKDMYFTFKNQHYYIEQLWSDLVTMVDISYEQKNDLLEFHMSNILDIYTYYVADLKDSVDAKKSDPKYISEMGANYDCPFIDAPYREIVQRMLVNKPHRGSLDSLYKLIELAASQFNWNKGALGDDN